MERKPNLFQLRFGNKENRFKKCRSLTCSNSGIQTIKKWIESLTGSNPALQTNNKDQIKLNSLTCSNSGYQTIKKWNESLTGSNRALQTNNKDQIKLNSLTCSNRYFANNLTIKNETKS
jgi:hypothetical protein